LVNIKDRIPRAHPIREVKRQIDQVLKSMDATFEKLYAEGGRNSVPPERLLKARVLMALYSVRSERQFCERLPYDALFQWFMDINMEEAEELAFDASVFAKNQSRFLEGKVSEVFFTQVVELARKGGWTSDEHFSVDGTLIDAWASMKSFRPKDEPKKPEDSNGCSDFKGQKRSNDTHQSKTDPEAKLLRKSKGSASKLCFGLHASMDNRNGLCVTLDVHQAVGKTETSAAIDALDKLKERGFKPKTLGADKGYHNQAAQPAKGRIRERLPRARSHTALRPDRRAAGRRTRRAHHEARRLPSQPDREAAHRTNLWLGQKHRRTAQKRPPRRGESQRRVPVCGRSLQPAAHGPVGDKQPRTTNRGGGHKPRVVRTAPKTPLAGRKTARKEARASPKARKTSEKEKRFSNHDVFQQPAKSLGSRVSRRPVSSHARRAGAGCR